MESGLGQDDTMPFNGVLHTQARYLLLRRCTADASRHTAG